MKEKKSTDKQLNSSSISIKKAKKPDEKIVKKPVEKKVKKPAEKKAKNPVKRLMKLKTPEKQKNNKSKTRFARLRAESESDDELIADTEVIPLSAGSKAVFKMVEYLKPSLNYKIFFDNWFSSLSLAYTLLEKGIQSTATIQIRRVKSKKAFNF